MAKELNPAPKEAIDLLDRMTMIEEEVKQLREDHDDLAKELARTNQRLATLEDPSEQWSPTIIRRAKKITEYINARPDHRALFETLKGHLQINDAQLSQTITLINKMHPGRYGCRKLQSDKRKKEIFENPKWS